VGEERESSPRNKSRRWAKIIWFFLKLKNCLLTNTFAKQQWKKTHGTQMNQWNPVNRDQWAPTEWAFDAQKRGSQRWRSVQKKRGKAYQFCFAVFWPERLSLPHILCKDILGGVVTPPRSSYFGGSQKHIRFQFCYNVTGLVNIQRLPTRLGRDWAQSTTKRYLAETETFYAAHYQHFAVLRGRRNPMLESYAKFES
jgi:hypothetical protein